MALALGLVHVDRLREVDLAREGLELLLRDLPRVREDGQLVAGERTVGEDVSYDVAVGSHGESKSARGSKTAA
jgi:hypothetical protein